jgi:hypothetical protein
LKKQGDIGLSSRVFGKMTRTQPIDESLNPEMPVDGYMWPRLSERSITGDVDSLNEDTRQFLNAPDDSKH